MATFITSKAVGNDITIGVATSTGYWKYNHDGSDSSVFSDGSQTITVANANGEFTIIPCLSDGTPSGNLTSLNLYDNQLTSFDGTGLTGLTNLDLGNNQLTTFDGTDLTSLTELYLSSNQLTSFDVTGLTSLITCYLPENQLTSFDGTGLTNLTELALQSNQLTSFDGTDLTSLQNLDLAQNGLSSISGFILPTSLIALGLYNNSISTIDLSNLTSLVELSIGACLISSVNDLTLPPSLNNLNLSSNQLTSFDGTGFSGLTTLILEYNQLTSFDGTGLTSLTFLQLEGNQIDSFDGTDLTSLDVLSLVDNLVTSFDGTDLTSLSTLNLNGNQLTTIEGFILPTSLMYLSLTSSKNNPNNLTYLSIPSLVNLTTLNVENNQLTSLANDSLLSQFASNGLTNGQFDTSGGRTSAGTTDYDYLIANGWNVSGADLPTPPSSGNGKLRIKGVNSGGGTTTTTTTEAPTTTTTTTAAPSLYWDSIALGSVDEGEMLPLNINFTEYGFADLTNTANRRTRIVIPSTVPSLPSNRVIIDGVEHVLIQVFYLDNTVNTGYPSQDPSIGSVNLNAIQDVLNQGDIMLSDQVKLAVVNQSSFKGSIPTYVTDSLSSTIGTVQDILDLLG